ncbi:MAG: Flp pilus assembly complex ATPase component TadA [Stenotrophomonas nitritireducens]|uniref:GspE/PulE family protein n=1 Tax=Stenotrophomonas nitritireducens TaxID=83617 RepID=UPI001AD5A96A|nr:type II/IV secretion system protein [Stenotrophomonas nitritireducens]MBN8793584.1 Flp pilus assembly complex ATPase component TadA [Stenotrophomonas nitritireducens]MBN8797155.1 Flp pilus assembly complex ATPase component TadA [Stenotrophomonas nitritireducens]
MNPMTEALFLPPVVGIGGLRLGEILVERGIVSNGDVGKALAFQEQYGGRIGSVLVRLGALSEESLLPVLSEQLGIPVVHVSEWPMEGEAIRGLLATSPYSVGWWLDNGVIAWESPLGNGILVAGADPLEPMVNEALARAFPGSPWHWRLIQTQDLARLLELANAGNAASDSSWDDDVNHLRELAEEAPVIELVNNMLAQAMDLRASDVHIEPEEMQFQVRMRIDGILHSRMTLPASRYPAVASRVKLISGMDIAERRLPQDGRLSIRVSGKEVDVRASAVPAVHGESIVMRLLPKERQDLNLERLGFSPQDLKLFRIWAREPHGVILVTGPTGSGKSTTLYGTLEELNQTDRKIITVEDPVEYEVKGVTQIQCNADIGYTFARALRAILRQDPDVIMIGEIRDLETAGIAVQSALTGHLVLSTLHTNDAVSAFTRLTDMGVEPFLVATSVRAVQAQRLVRKLCTQCSEPAEVSPAIESLVAGLFDPESPAGWRQPKGCPQCQGSGYRGRIGIYELVDVTPAMQELIVSRAPAERMRALADAQGGRGLREDGLLKARAGLTSVDEVVRVTGGIGLDD